MPFDDTAHLNRARVRIAHLEAERDALQAALEEAQPVVCSYLCPSVWPTGQEQPHSPLCVAIRQALAYEDR